MRDILIAILVVLAFLLGGCLQQPEGIPVLTCGTCEVQSHCKTWRHCDPGPLLWEVETCELQNELIECDDYLYGVKNTVICIHENQIKNCVTTCPEIGLEMQIEE